MSRALPSVDVALVGGGWTGSIVGKELAAAGMRAVVLERGPARWTSPDFQAPMVHDGLRYARRRHRQQDAAKETYTFRNNEGETALPLRRWGAFNPGTGLGGAGAHWSGAYYRFDENEFRLRSHYARRHGARIFADGITAQDWPLTYAAGRWCTELAEVAPTAVAEGRQATRTETGLATRIMRLSTAAATAASPR